MEEKAVAKQEKKQETKEGKEKKSKGKEDEEEQDPTKYLENRKKWIVQQKEKGHNPYPHKFHVSITLNEFVKNISTYI